MPGILGVLGTHGFGTHGMTQPLQTGHQGPNSHSANARAWQQGPGPALLEQTLQMGMGVGANGRALPPSTLQLQLQTALLRQALSQQATHGTQQSLLDVAESRWVPGTLLSATQSLPPRPVVSHLTSTPLSGFAPCSIAKQANLMALHHDMLVRDPLPPPVPPPPQHLFQRIQAGLNKNSQAAGALRTTSSSSNATTDS